MPIAYEVHGQGSPAVVLVHGWSCDRGYWKEQIEYLAPQYRLVLIDLAGHGESGTGAQGLHHGGVRRGRRRGGR